MLTDAYNIEKDFSLLNSIDMGCFLSHVEVGVKLCLLFLSNRTTRYKKQELKTE